MISIELFAEVTARALEALGIGVIAAGALYATLRAALMARTARGREVFSAYRRLLGRGILLGLEFLVAADIITTVAVEPSFRSVGVLGIIVLIRTFLSFTLEVEMTGRWPWQGGTEESKEHDIS
ncbi:MAG: DUF1622 domain-containing protein [Nitrospirota bacterium]